MYSECITCPQIGKTCDGPNFITMTAQDLLSWCKKRKKHLQISNGDLAELSNMPKGTIDRLLSGNPDIMDFKYETIRPLVKALVGGEVSGNPCPAPPAENHSAMAERLRDCEKDLKWQEDKIQHLEKETEILLEQIKEKDLLLHERSDFIKRKDKAISILGTVAGVCLAVIIAALIIDRLNPDIGFFWLGDALHFFEDEARSLPDLIARL